MWFYNRAEEKGGWMSGGVRKAWECNHRYPWVVDEMSDREATPCQNQDTAMLPTHVLMFYSLFNIPGLCSTLFHLLSYLQFSFFQHFFFSRSNVDSLYNLCLCPISSPCWTPLSVTWAVGPRAPLACLLTTPRYVVWKGWNVPRGT